MTGAVSRTFGNLFASQGPTSQPYAMGATIEIQRQQQMEHYEQQALRVARMGSLRNRVLLKKLHILNNIFTVKPCRQGCQKVLFKVDV